MTLVYKSRIQLSQHNTDTLGAEMPKNFKTMLPFVVLAAFFMAEKRLYLTNLNTP